MDKPISLGMFNILPHLTPAFFEYSLRLEQYRWDHPFMKFEFGSFCPHLILEIQYWAWAPTNGSHVVARIM